MIQVQLKLRPTKAQARTLDRWLWHLTGVWNWAIRKIERDAEAGIRYSAYDLKRLLKGHSRRLEIPTDALGGTLDTARIAWARRFNGLGGRPRMKGRRRPMTSIAFDHWRGSLRNGRAVVYGIGSVRFHRQEIPEGRISSGRIVRRASGWWGSHGSDWLGRAEGKAVGVYDVWGRARP